MARVWRRRFVATSTDLPTRALVDLLIRYLSLMATSSGSSCSGTDIGDLDTARAGVTWVLASSPPRDRNNEMPPEFYFGNKEGAVYGHGRPHIGANGVSWSPEKIDEKLKSESMQKRAVFYQSINQSIMLFRVVQVTKSLQDPLFMLYFDSNQGRQMDNGAMLTTHLFRYTSTCTIS